MIRIAQPAASRSAKILFVNLASILFLCAGWSHAQSVNIIPLPNSVVAGEGRFPLTAGTVIGMNNDSLLLQAHYLQNELYKVTGLTVAADRDESKAGIDLRIVNDGRLPGAYVLAIQPQKITITAAGEEGVFYGIISLLQLAEKQPLAARVNLPALIMTDAPRYSWRGFMLDESRHFFGKQKVKQLLDWMARYKMNRFHWHLTDVDGWRIAINKYPRLALTGGIGNHSDTAAAARYYTQDDIKEIVAYARDRFITVIPEVDMPGHATAANRAYPEFSGGSIARYPNFTFDPANEQTYHYLAEILREISTLFPGRMMHLGGDEVALGIQAWAGRPAITAMLTKNNLASLADLEHYFFRRMADTVISLNDEVLCWDEAAETNLPAGKAIVFWWRQNVPQALKLALQKNYRVVLCPRLPLYFDFVQDKDNVSGRKWEGRFNSLSDVYNFPDQQLLPDEIATGQVLGIQANLWTETVESEKRLDYLVFPRIAALAEAGWTGMASKNEASFRERLKPELALYDKAGIYYYNPFDPAAHPEAIDFAPNLITPHARSASHRRHGRHEHGRHRRGHEGHGRRKGRSGSSGEHHHHHSKTKKRHRK